MRAVPHTDELDRILALPRREHVPGIQFRPNPPQALFPIQHVALTDFAAALRAGARGALLPLGVGAGKSLICCLAGLAAPSTRRMLWLVPANLVVQSTRIAATATKTWSLPYEIVVTSYEYISHAKQATWLDDQRFDLIACDEAHKLRGNSVRTRRFKRYLGTHKPLVLFLSGTITRRSLMDFAWMVHYTHGAHAPVPLRYTTLEDWDRALAPQPPGRALAPGALHKLGGTSPIAGFRDRLVSTLGIVATTQASCDAALNITLLTPTSVVMPPAIQAALKQVRTQHATPHGVSFADDANVADSTAARYLRQLALGYWLKFDREMPQDWLDARANWHDELRAFLRRAPAGRDSPALVVQAINRGELQSQYLADWQAAKAAHGDMRYSTPEWISDYAVQLVRTHCATAPTGVVWYHGIAFGNALRAQGMDVFMAGDDAALVDRAARGGGWIACSISAHGTGKNLQRYSNALIVSPPASGAVWEQLLGRHHRQGQESDEVNVTVWQFTPEQRIALERSRTDADTYLDTVQGPQLLTRATYIQDFLAAR